MRSNLRKLLIALILLVVAFGIKMLTHSSKIVTAPIEDVQSIYSGHTLLEDQLDVEQKRNYHYKALLAFSDYLHHLESSFGVLEDFNIDSITVIVEKPAAQDIAADWFSPETSNDAFLAQIHYSVKPEYISPEEGTAWIAGNGMQTIDGWIVDKVLVVVFDEKDGKIEVVNAGTGPI